MKRVICSSVLLFAISALAQQSIPPYNSPRRRPRQHRQRFRRTNGQANPYRPMRGRLRPASQPMPSSRNRLNTSSQPSRCSNTYR